MAIAQYFEDFKLGDKFLSDFNGIIYNKSDGHSISLAPTTTYITEKLPNRDGELHFGSTVDPRTIDISVYFDDEVDLQELSAWLCKKTSQTLSFVDDDKEIDVLYQGNLNMIAYYNDPFQGVMDISFVAYNPYFRAINEKDIVIKTPSINVANSIKIRGNVESYPILKITPNGSQAKIRFNMNGIIVSLQNVTKSIYLDCELEDVYEFNLGQKISVREKFYSTDFYEFPTMLPFIANKITIIEGGVSELCITPRSRIL